MFGKIVRFECGCIGTLPKPGIPVLMFEFCDRNSEIGEDLDFQLTHADEARVDGLLKKSWEPLTEDQVLELIEKISHLVYDGYRYRRIVSTIKQGF